MTSKIFISYRREDSRGSAGRLYDQLSAYYGKERIFMDVDTIEPGLDFVDAIESAVKQSDVQIVVIGPNWVNATDTSGNLRLDNPEDFVRTEIATALKMKIRVIPVLVESAEMPHSTDLPDDLKSLSRRNALEISHSRFGTDVQRLIHYVERALKQAEIGRNQQAEAELKRSDEVSIDKNARTKSKRSLRDLIPNNKVFFRKTDVTKAKSSNKGFIKQYLLPIVLFGISWAAVGYGITEIPIRPVDVLLFDADIYIPLTMYAIFGMVLGIVNAIILRFQVPKLGWKQLIFIATGWSLSLLLFGYTIYFLTSGSGLYYYPLIYSFPELEPILRQSLYFLFFGPIIGFLGGLINGIALRHIIPNFHGKQIFLMALGWATGWLMMSIHITFFRKVYIYHFSIVLIWFVLGIFSGGFTLWQIKSVEQKN